MRRQQLVSLAIILALFLLGGFGSTAVRAGVIYDITLNTSSLNGQSGYLDFQFNPGASGAPAATATITDFTSGTPASTDQTTNDASGLLPGTLTLGNGTAYNDLFQGFTYGSTFSFELTLSGAALDNPSGSIGSTFALSLYAADGVTPLLTTDPNGSVLTINVNSNGTTSVETFAQSSTDSTPAAAATPLNPVPEPSSLVLTVSSLSVGLFGWQWFRRPHRR